MVLKSCRLIKKHGITYNLIRYMTGLSKNSHITNTRKILKILSIDELNKYMKLIFFLNLIKEYF